MGGSILKVGDKVKVIKLDWVDELETEIKEGMTGVIKKIYEYRNPHEDDCIDVVFDDILDLTKTSNYDEDEGEGEGTYTMYRHQLEVVND